MDAFSYYYDNAYHVEAVFNLKYLAVNASMKAVYASSLSTAICAEERVNNSMISDIHKHTIITVFHFRGECDKHKEVTIYHKESNTVYRIHPPYIEDYSRHRYHLSICSSIARIDTNRVRMWLYYYYYHGVEHVSLLANEQYDYWKNELYPFIRRGFLDVVNLEYPNHYPFYEQQVGLQMCNRHHRFASSFVIYNDVDEFFHPLNTTKRIVDVLDEYDVKYPNAYGFRVLDRSRIH